MSKEVYRYTFAATVPTVEIEEALVLSAFAVESLHGESAARLDIGHYFDVDTRRCAVDASTAVGSDFNKLFVGFVRRLFGADAFAVERCDEPPRKDAAIGASLN